MNLTRRSFLHMGSMVGLAAMVGGGSVAAALGKQRRRHIELGSGMTFPIPKNALQDTLSRITMAMFEANINTKFRVTFRGAFLTELVLIAVNNLNPPFVKNPPGGTKEAYALVFRSGNIDLPQNTYTFESTKLGKFDLLLVPATVGILNRHYEANINRV